MRKSLFLTLVLSLCMVDVGGFAATRGGRGSAPAAGDNAAPVAARAGARQKVVATSSAPSTSSAASAPATNGNTAARAGKKQQVASGPKPMAARAGATQKVIQTGSKVATATANTAIPQECQDSFFGCMDSFCMLDNTSGGRCQCSDRVIELDKVLADILKLDEQSYAMATEGVERIQMGEAEEQILARAKDAADRVTAKEDQKKAGEKKVRTLDLSAWNNNIFNDNEEDVFGDSDSAADPLDTFADKKGDELYKEVAKLCVTKVPKTCQEHGSMVQLMYAQRIKSDCAAYENSLKQQKIASTQKLQAAEKALREAALEEHKNQNKYETAGECAVAFAQCMQTTAECGSDYTGCVTLAAKENLKNNKSGSKATQTTIKGAVAGANITLAASTMESLLAKKEICQKVIRQCVTANKKQDVWTIFLRNAAPALKTAEEMAEQNLRMNCIPSVAECFKTACKSNIDPKDEKGSYDMCLSNPETYKSFCKVQLEPCLEATGGSYDNPTGSTLWNGLVAALNAMKVDACTDQVRSCLTERCGDDFAGCVGMDTESIGDICPEDKLTACMTNYDKTTIRKYVNEIAQGLAIQIDNSMLTVCQKAVNDVMMNVCGATDTCNLSEEKSEDADIMKRDILKYQVCTRRQNMSFHSFLTSSSKSMPSFSTCKDRSSVMDGDLGKYEPVIRGENLYDCLSIEKGEDAYALKNMCVTKTTTLNKGQKVTKEVELDPYLGDFVEALNKNLKTKLNYFTTDPTIAYCMSGRQIQGFDGKKFGTKGETPQGRFPNLLDNISVVIARGIYDSIGGKYSSQMSSIRQQIEKDMATAEKNLSNKQKCEAKAVQNNWIGWKNGYRRKNETVASYDSASKVCTVINRELVCGTWHIDNARRLICDDYWSVTGETKKTIQM